MPNNPRVLELVEELLNSGSSVEDVCRDSPELLSQVRAEWRKLQRLQEHVGAIFPDHAFIDDDPTPPDLGPPIVPGFDLTEVLGRGGAGVVYKAWQLNLNRPVALKMLLAGAWATRSERQRFAREAEVVAKLRHPHIVQIYDVGDLDGRPYFTMEYVEGGNLDRKLAGTPRPAIQAATLVATLAEAIQAAHEQGIVHRDLKPSNVLLTGDGTPKISDFGLARHVEAVSALTQSGAAVGTPSYMAPEQAQGKTRETGPAADIYALGAVLYETLTGRPPFRAETAVETVHQVITQDPVPPSRLNAKVPRDLETICLKCLQKDPQKRYATAQALAQDLHRFRDGEPIAARPAGALERSARWVRKNPSRATMLAIGFLLALGISGGTIWLLSQRAATTRAVKDDLDLAARALQESSWSEAQSALERAKFRLGAGGGNNLRARLDDSSRALNLAERLDRVRVQRADSGMRDFDDARTERNYRQVFQDAGLWTPGDSPAQVAERIKTQQVRGALVVALDAWITCCPDAARQKELGEIARLADQDPGSRWRARARDPRVRNDPAAVLELARDAPFQDDSVPLLEMVAALLQKAGGDRITFMKRIQSAHPRDFWAAFQIAEFLENRNDAESIGYYRAAISLRPTAVASYVNLGILLNRIGRLDEALEYLQTAVRIAPLSPMTHLNLAVVLSHMDRLEEATEEARKAVELGPNLGHALVVFGHTLMSQRRYSEARDAFVQGLKRMPANDPSRSSFQGLLETCEYVLSLKNRLPGVIRGTDQPVDANEYKAFVELLIGEKRHAAATRLVAAALAQTPEFLATIPPENRYDFARVAAMAGCGQGKDAPPIETAEAAALRKKGLAWLKAECHAVYPATPFDTSRKPYYLWLVDPKFAGVRDPKALAKLPVDERQEWRELWENVEILALRERPLSIEMVRGFVAKRQWRKAAAAYTRFLEATPTDSGEIWFELAATQLLAGDRDAYRKTCETMLDRCRRIDEMRPYHAARACTLDAHSADKAAKVIPLVLSELQNSPAEFWCLTQRAALVYRAGQARDAVPLLKQSIEADGQPGKAVLNWLWLALAYQKQGNIESARHYRDKARALLEACGDTLPDNADQAIGLHRHNWLEAHVLRLEVESIVQ